MTTDPTPQAELTLVCYRQWNQSPKCLSCLSLKRLREEGPNPFQPTDLCPVCDGTIQAAFDAHRERGYFDAMKEALP